MSIVFNAVSDGTRRELLERLRLGGPQSIKALAADLPMSRQAVTKHLGVLAEAGLVRKETRGRETMHALDGSPLRAMSDWLAPYEAEWDARLERLRAHVDGGHSNERRQGGAS